LLCRTVIFAPAGVLFTFHEAAMGIIELRYIL
jgi:hypothetical protein